MIRLDQVIERLTYRFQDRDVICDLWEICFGENAKIEEFENISKFYSLKSELLQCDYTVETIF